ncbi:TolC family protein [Pseudomonas sp. MDT2-39-1]
MSRVVLSATLLFGSSYSYAFEHDIFATTQSISSQRVQDLDGVSVPCLFAPLPEELSLEETIERILCHDPQTRLAWAEAKAQAARVGISKSAFLPRLDGSVSRYRGNNKTRYDDFPDLSSDGDTLNSTNRLGLNWVLFDFGRRGAALRNAQELLQAANADQNATLQRTFVLAAQVYYEALAAQQSLNISTSVADLAAENLKAADAKYKSGAAALSDRLQAQTAASQARLRQLRDAGHLRKTMGLIALYMGLAPETSLRLNGDLTQLPDVHFVKSVDELLQLARREHPALLAAQSRVIAAEALVDERRAAGRPTIALTANLSRARIDQSEGLYGDTREHGRSIGLELKIPLFEGFERNYQVRNARARAEAEQAELASTEEHISLEVWGSYQSLNVETKSLEQIGELVRQSRQSLEVVQGRYRAGVGSMLELLNALTAYAAAEDQHTQSLNAWQLSRLKLAASLGRLGFWAVK